MKRNEIRDGWGSLRASVDVGVVRACDGLRGKKRMWKRNRERERDYRHRRELLTSTLAFRPIECILYRLVDAYLLAEAFSRVALCNFWEVASAYITLGVCAEAIYAHRDISHIFSRKSTLVCIRPFVPWNKDDRIHFVSRLFLLNPAKLLSNKGESADS